MVDQISDTLQKVKIGDTTFDIDGNSLTLTDEEVETFTTGQRSIFVYFEDKVYSATILVKKVISTKGELAALESFITVTKDGNADGYIELGNNIDMENAVVAGVGSSSDGVNRVNKWIGSFDGKGFTISKSEVCLDSKEPKRVIILFGKIICGD